MKWILIRHGQTQGNREHRYIGCRTDEPLCPEGIAQLQNRHYPPVSRVFVSPMRRCVETANLLYPGVPQTIIGSFRECDFGDFENKNYAELNGRADYQAWIDSGGELPFPHGESRAQFAARCVTAFEQIRQQDEDCAVINSNYAISAGLDPMTDALAMEDGSSAYVNVLVCKEGNENEPKIKALVAALQSQQVKDFMDENYKGAVVSVVENPTDGYDPSIDYDALNGETVSCAATPAPHCEVLEVCKDILAAKGITLDIQEYDDYVIPNTIVEDGQCDTNYFQHQPYLDNFNEEKGTHLVTVAGIHVEPMGIYGGKQDSLAPIEG